MVVVRSQKLGIVMQKNKEELGRGHVERSCGLGDMRCAEQGAEEAQERCEKL